MQRDEAVKKVYEHLEEALDAIDCAIGTRDEAKLANLNDLDLIRAEIHGLTCRPQFETVRRELDRVRF